MSTNHVSAVTSLSWKIVVGDVLPIIRRPVGIRRPQIVRFVRSVRSNARMRCYLLTTASELLKRVKHQREKNPQLSTKYRITITLQTTMRAAMHLSPGTAVAPCIASRARSTLCARLDPFSIFAVRRLHSFCCRIVRYIDNNARIFRSAS